MALSRELLKRLNSDDYPLAKRLKLAETAFCTVDLPLVRKEDLLLEWLFQNCATDQLAWQTLNNCLKLNHFNIRTDVKQYLIDLLIQTLQNNMENIYEDVLECCSLVLSNNSMQQYFIYKPKMLGLLIRTLLNNPLECFNNVWNIRKRYSQLFEPCKLSSVENETIINAIESLMQIYKQLISTKDELKLIFMRDILYPMCVLVDHTHIDNKNRLGIAAYKCIQQLLLGKSKSIQNKQIGDSDQAIFLDLFHVLSEHTKIRSSMLDLRSNLLTCQFIFRAVIGTYKSDVTLLDIFFRNLISSSGKYKWEIMDSCLKLLNDITLDFDNVVNGVTLMEYLQDFISEILTLDDITYIHHNVLIQLSYTNPLLIEKNISDIFNKIIIKELMKKEVAAQCINLLIAILDASTKLRREQKFISQLLISIKQYTTKQTYKPRTSAFLPNDFNIKLVETISNFSSSQIVTTLRTLVYYLNTDCVELLQSNTSCENILMLKITIELLITFFEGMQIFEYTRILSAHEKFINGLNEVGNVLSLLINKALHLSYNTYVIVILLKAVQSLSELQNMYKYYILKNCDTKKLIFPIMDDPWQQLIQRITNFGRISCKTTMNTLISHRLKLNASDKPIKLHRLIPIKLCDFEYSWSTIFLNDTEMISLLHDEEISKITFLLLTFMTWNEPKFHYWISILDKECLQENKRFVMYLLNHILFQIGKILSLNITGDINIKLLMDNEHNEKLLEVLQILKEQISQEQWIEMTDTFYIKLYLEIFLHLPIIYFNPDIRTLIFLITYFISRKYEKDDKISTLCNIIFSDLLEKPGINILQYIEPKLLIHQLAKQNKTFLKACEFSFRNVRTYSILKNLVNSCGQCKEATYIILECMEAVKSKLDTEQKVIFRKAEKKLAKTILKILPENINDVFDVKCLTIVLKVAFQTGKFTDALKRSTELTLKNIITAREKSSDEDNQLLQQYIQLSIIVLQHRKIFEIQEDIIKNLWYIMLKHPYKNLIELLLASTGLQEFLKFLKLLQDQTITSLSQKDELTWTNLFIIWSSIMKTDMNVKRNKVRLSAINNLFKTVLMMDISHEYWSRLLCLSHDIINAKHLIIPNVTIDLIILISIKSLDKTNVSLCEHVLAICKIFIKTKTDLIIDRLPNLLLLYRRIVNYVVHTSKNIGNELEHQFRRFALDITKFTSTLVKLKKDMIRLSPYVIADLLQLIIEGTIPSYIKMALQESLCQLISICDQHGFAFLSRTLPASLQEIFKVQLNIFKKFYKYSGKI